LLFLALESIWVMKQGMAVRRCNVHLPAVFPFDMMPCGVRRDDGFFPILSQPSGVSDSKWRVVKLTVY
jgi:hypothetical protein